MDDKTTALIEKLAEKLGTTTEHLWSVLLHQASLSGTVYLVISVIMVLSMIIVVAFVVNKTTKPAKTENDIYPEAEWENEDATLAWFVAIILLIIMGGFVAGLANRIVTAFFNPEYWALSHILGKIQ